MGDEAQKATAELVATVAQLAATNNALANENMRLRAMLERLGNNQPPGLWSRTAAPRGRG